MNVQIIFHYLENKKNKKIPIEYKLRKKLKLNEYDFFIDGDLSLYDSRITKLPEGLIISGNLVLTFSDIIEYPYNIQIGKNLFLQFTLLSDQCHDNKSLKERIVSTVKGRTYF